MKKYDAVVLSLCIITVSLAISLFGSEIFSETTEENQPETQNMVTGQLAPVDNQASTKPQEQSSQSVSKSIDASPSEEDYEEVIENLPDFVIQSENGFDLRKKQEQVKQLVQKAVDYFEDNSFDKSFNVFSHSADFREGELYLFVYTNDGTVLAHGGWPDMLWKNQWNEQDDYGVYLVRKIVETARERGSSGGWVNYHWRGASKRSFVRQIKKGERTYVIGSGYYPHSKADAVINLVQGAAAYFNDVVQKEGRSVEDAFSTFSYPLGRFVQGDLYLYALAFDGTVMAHGERPGLVGTNGLDFKDPSGILVNQEIIRKLKNASGPIWQKYTSKNAPKIAYAEEVVDKEDNHYFIASGYYPDANRNEVVELVKRGYQFFKRHGRDAATKEFSDKRNKRFRYGDLALVVHDFDGTIVADGTNPDLVGSPSWNFKDQDGKYIVREIIARAKAGGGWVSFKLNNAYKLSYIEEIKIGQERYAISSGLYPISKEETMWLMVKSAVSTFSSESLEDALRKFVKGESGFLRGDLWLYVIDAGGIVLAWGNNYNNIWRNFINEKDDLGKPYIRMLINAVRQGPATITYVIDNMKRLAYAEEVLKEGRRYLVGSAYFF